MILSIIIPLYNTEQYILKCIESCVSQDIASYEYEIIVVNDGSTDNGLNVVRKFASEYSNITVLSKLNGGLSSARNYGLKHAKGDYIWFVDSDDWIEQNCLKQLTTKICNEDADVVQIYADTFYQGEQRHRIPIKEINTISGSQFLREHQYEVCCPFYVFRRTFLESNSFIFAEGLLHEDLEFTPRVLYKAKKITNLPKVLYHVYRRENSITTSRNNAKRSYDLLEISVRYSNYLNTVMNRDKIIFYDLISLCVNKSLFNCYDIDNSIRKDISRKIFKYKLYNYLKASSIKKYVVEGWLFSLACGSHIFDVYRIIQFFNSDKGGVKRINKKR